MKYKIIADSSCDLKAADLVSEKFDFVTVPLSILVGDKNYVDKENLSIKELIDDMKLNKKSIGTACPSPETFAEEMRKGDNIICVTISSKLSGTYNSARLAAETVQKESPDKKIFVLDTLTASSGMILIINELKDLIESGKYSFDEISKIMASFVSTVNTRFVLQDLGNLIKSGRMSKITGLIALVLTIRVICGDNGAGEIKMYAKAFGTKKALVALSSHPAEKVDALGKNIPVVITHCFNEADANYFKQLLESRYGLTNVKIYPMRGLASFYANDKGLTIAF